MKKVIALIELCSGMALGIYGVTINDTGMIVVGCMLIICGKIDFNETHNQL